jgi:hypothetical protein
MKNVLSHLLTKVNSVDERTLRMLFVVASMVFMLIQNSPTDGSGGIR